MTDEEALLAALLAAPSDALTWLALADWLEEGGQPDRAEVLRLWRGMHALPWEDEKRLALQGRLQKRLRAGVVPYIPEVVNSVGMRLVLLPPGEFWMGAERDDPERREEELPRHVVEITRAFHLGRFPVTQRQYEAVTGRNPSYFAAGAPGALSVVGVDTRDFPVEMITAADAAAFCERLSALPAEQGAGRVYRLPSEAEWEYACRAGTSTPFYLGNEYTSLDANFDGKYPEPITAPRGPYLARTCTVGRYPPNAWGLYDMTGNVWEWCGDWSDRGYYRRSPRRDPQGPLTGTRRARQGGSWYMNGNQCRSAYRSGNPPVDASQYCGLRVVMVPAGANDPFGGFDLSGA